MLLRRSIPACALALAACLSSLAQAATVALPTDGSWQTFIVDELQGDASLAWKNDAGEPVIYTFTVSQGHQATLRVVDLGFAGDSFDVLIGTSAYIATGTPDVPTVHYTPELASTLDPAVAQASAAYSQSSWVLGPGSWSVEGRLRQSVLLDGQPLNATAGALNVTVSAVPEPATVATLLAGLALIGATLRRRAR